MQPDTYAQPSVSRTSLLGSNPAPAINRWATFSCPLSRTGPKRVLGQSLLRLAGLQRRPALTQSHLENPPVLWNSSSLGSFDPRGTEFSEIKQLGQMPTKSLGSLGCARCRTLLHAPGGKRPGDPPIAGAQSFSICACAAASSSPDPHELNIPI